MKKALVLVGLRTVLVSPVGAPLQVDPAMKAGQIARSPAASE